MTTSTGRSSDTRRSGRSIGQWLLGLLIVLALAASVLMVFAGNMNIPGTLAVIAALWAAVIGAILVTRFRKQAESAEAKSRDLRLVYELQLEREIAARRQYELDVETAIRKEVAAESGAELLSLKEQVVSLRSSLERLRGEPLPEDQAALPNEKLRELASGLGGARPSGYGAQTEYTQGEYTQSEYTQHGYAQSGYAQGGYTQAGDHTAADYHASPEFGGAPAFAGHDDGMVAARDFAQTAPTTDDGRHRGSSIDPNEMTEVIPVVTDDPLSGRIAEVETTEADAAASAPAQSFYEQPVEPETSAHAPGAAAYEGGASRYVDESPTDEWGNSPAEQAPPAEQAVPIWAQGRHESSAATPAAGGRRRRRDDAEFDRGQQAPVEQPVAEAAPVEAPESAPTADDFNNAHSNGFPVSELLRQLRETDGSSAGGRRRRPD